MFQENKALCRIMRTVCHDLTSTLTGLKIGAQTLKQYLPALIDGYRKAQMAGLEISPIRADRFQMLEELQASLVGESEYAVQYLRRMSKKIFLDQYSARSDGLSLKAGVMEAIDTYQPKYFLRDKSKLTVTIQDERIQADKDLLLLILYELLYNADYHLCTLSSAGELRIESERQGDKILLRVKTIGLGVNEKNRSQLFDPFFSTSDKPGLGLTFCREALKKMNSEIVCDSVEDEFIQFTLAFPSSKD